MTQVGINTKSDGEMGKGESGNGESGNGESGPLLTVRLVGLDMIT